MQPYSTGALLPHMEEFDELPAEPENMLHHCSAFSHNSFGVTNSSQDLFPDNFNLNSFNFEFSNNLLSPPPPPLLPPLPPTLPPPQPEEMLVDSMFSENSDTNVSSPNPLGLTARLSLMSLEKSNTWASSPGPLGPAVFSDKLNVDSSWLSPIKPTISPKKLNVWASRPSPLRPNLSLEKSNVVASRPGPVGPTVGSNSSGDGGQENKGKRPYRRSASPMTTFEGKPVSLVKKALDRKELAELARVDPQKFKRIVANRKSAAISKERRMRHITDLEEEAESLGIKVTNTLNDVCRLQDKNAKRAIQLKECRMWIEARREDLRIRNAICEEKEEELQRLKIETDHYATILSGAPPSELFPEFASQLPLQQFHNPPIFQHLAPPQETQFHMPNPLPPPSQNFNEQYDLDFSNYFNQTN